MVQKGQANMNQIFRITVGQETILGRLPPVRVGQGYSSLFHISGVAATCAAPKLWITTKTVSVDPETEEEIETTDTRFWTAVWSTTLGLWVVSVGNLPTQNTGSYLYAVTMCGGGQDAPEYIAGQGSFVVYSNIANGGASGEGEGGTSIMEMIEALTERVEALEAVLTAGAELPMFDPESAFDIDMRNQVQAITNLLRGTEVET